MWSGREEPSRSLLYLLAARGLYATLDPLMSDESKRLHDEAANAPRTCTSDKRSRADSTLVQQSAMETRAAP